METLKTDFLKVFRTERGLLLIAVLNFSLSILLLVLSILSLNPNSSGIKIGYGDIGGYRDGSWTDILVFPLLGLVFGVFHNLLALRIFHKRGSGMAKFFLIATTLLILGTILIFNRILGEG